MTAGLCTILDSSDAAVAISLQIDPTHLHMHGYTSVTLEVAGRRTDEDEDRESERCLTENPFSKNMEKKNYPVFFSPAPVW